MIVGDSLHFCALLAPGAKKPRLKSRLGPFYAKMMKNSVFIKNGMAIANKDLDMIARIWSSISLYATIHHQLRFLMKHKIPLRKDPIRLIEITYARTLYEESIPTI